VLALALAVRPASGEDIVLSRTPLGPMPASPLEMSLTPDASHVALLANAGSRRVVYIDGNQGPPYSSVRQASAQGDGRPRPALLMISPDGTRVAYVATRGPTDCVVVVNHKEGPVFESIAGVTFSPVGHRLAYVGSRGGKSYVVVDASIGPGYGLVSAADLQFSPDGQHVGYVARDAATPQSWHAVIDGKENEGFAGVERLQFSREGDHFVYVARTSNAEEFSVVVDGVSGPKYALVQSVTLSRDGTHVAYVARKPRDPKGPSKNVCVAVIDGKPGPDFGEISDVVLSPDGTRSAYAAWDTAPGRGVAYAVVDGAKSLDYVSCSTFTFSPDGRHLVYVATNNDKSVVVLDGQESDAHKAVAAESLRFSADGKRLGYVASDEDGWRAVVDGKAGPARSVIDGRSFAFSPDGRHFRFKARVGSAWATIDDDAPAPAPGEPVPCETATSADGRHTASVLVSGFETSQQTMRVVLDGKPVGPECQTVQHLLLSADGRHVAYSGTVIESGGGGRSMAHVVFDGRPGPGFLSIESVGMSADGEHVACVARDEMGKKHVVVDGFEGPAYDDVVSVTGDCPQAIRFQADGSLHFLAVSDRKLARVVMSADAIRALPKPVDPHAAGAPGYAQIHVFGSVENDGAKPAVVAAAPDGTLFGATTAGGEFQKGVIFRVAPDGTGYRVLRSIEGGQGDGAYPSSIFVAKDGAICGSLMGEGPSSHGVVYRMAADGSGYTILHAFTGNKDGGSPTLYAVDADGTLYGVSSRNRTPLHLFRLGAGGGDFKAVYDAPQTPDTPDQGVGPFVDGGDGFFYGVAGMHVFKVAKDGTGYAVVRKFQGPPRDIQWADRAPVLGADGMLYAFASSGGKSTGGVVYKLARDGSGYAIVLDPAEPLSPRALAEGPDGKLYALGHPGLVRMNKDGSGFEVLEPLAGGFFPWAAVVHDGAFYGMTAQGPKGGFLFRYGIGAAGAAAPSAPTVTFQDVPPPPIDSTVEVPASGA
jgi:uncharacterized repeat protein (TIGR03803 family)